MTLRGYLSAHRIHEFSSRSSMVTDAETSDITLRSSIRIASLYTLAQQSQGIELRSVEVGTLSLCRHDPAMTVARAWTHAASTLEVEPKLRQSRTAGRTGAATRMTLRA